MRAVDPLGRAEHLLDVGRAGDAVAMLTLHLAAEPRDAHALRLLALAHLLRLDLPAAHEAVSAALRAEPDAESGHRLAAIVAGRSGRFREAHEHADQAVRLNPESWQARVVLAQALLNRRRARKAQEQARRAVSLAPEQAAAHMQLSITTAARRQSRSAARSLAEALRLDPTAHEVLDYKAFREVEQGRLTQAATSIRQSLQANPTSARGQDNLERMVVALLARTIAVVLTGGIALMLLLGAELDGDIPAWWPRATTGVATILLVAIVTSRTMSAFPPAARRHALALPRTFRGRRLAVLVVAAVLGVSVAWLAFLPATVAHWGSVAVVLTFGLGVTVSLVSAFQDLWHRVSRVVR